LRLDDNEYHTDFQKTKNYLETNQTNMLWRNKPRRVVGAFSFLAH